jgi:hypothetical protein
MPDRALASRRSHGSAYAKLPNLPARIRQDGHGSHAGRLHHRRPLHLQRAGSDRRTWGPPPPPYCLSLEGRTGGRRSSLRCESSGGVVPSGCLCGQDPERRQASRLARRAADAIRGLGVLLVVTTGRADQLGLGRYPGFGWLQGLEVVIGVVVLLVGLHLRK